MRIERRYRKLEDVEEIQIFDIHEKELFRYIPQQFEIEKFPFEKTLDNITNDLDIFTPYNDGEDFIVNRLGLSALARGYIKQSDVSGRLLSKVSPAFHEMLIDSLREVYKTGKVKRLQILYHFHEKLARFSNVRIVYEQEKIILISDHRDNRESRLHITEEEKFDEKANFIEYFSQTGSYYKIKDKYTWTHGIYNIINRARAENDEYYNIVFDMVIPEDKPVVEKMLRELDNGRQAYESIIRIKTDDGTLKYIEVNLYSKFDENGKLISRYGLLKDVSSDSNRKIGRPVDYLLNGFKNSKKLALLIEPLNTKQYEFSQGFYHLIEIPAQNYKHSREVLENIEEKEVIEKIKEVLDGYRNEIEIQFTYNVNGDSNNQKMCEMYLERFNYGSETHSLGFITDVTEERQKQQALMEANEHQKVLIKEVHHRVKNNLQILNSFLNLEKRAYKDKPNIIIDHMQSRLSSLAILHEKTYNTTDFKNINLKSYIEDQDAQLTSLIGLRDGIKFISDVDENLNLSIEIITPLLLVIDEITMNSIKHAFPDKTEPNKIITKEIRALDSNSAELTIKDNGIGIKNPKMMMENNLGCEIIKNLTKQLNGTIKLTNTTGGTEYKLIFPTTMEHTITQ